MYKLDLEKTEEPEINCQHSLDHKESKRIPEKNIYFCFVNYAKAFDYVDHNKLENSERDGHTILLRNRLPKLGKEYVKAIYLYLFFFFFKLIYRVYHVKCWAS